MAKTDSQKTVTININAAGDINTALDGLMSRFQDLSKSVDSFKIAFSPIVDSLSNAKVSATFAKALETLKSMEGIKLPDLTEFANGLNKVTKLDGKSADLSNLVGTIKQFDKLTVPGLLQFANGLTILGKSASTIGVPLEVLRLLHGSLLKLSELGTIPNLSLIHI